MKMEAKQAEQIGARAIENCEEGKPPKIVAAWYNLSTGRVGEIE